MFKSKFANALSTMMAGALGMANIEGKLSVGYGAEAGEMDPPLLDFVRRRCRQSLIVCRNEPSRELLSGMGIRALGGTDTAWTFDPAPLARGAALLEAHGWDGRRPVLVVCPINPFWWPVKPDFVKAAAYAFGGQYRAERYIAGAQSIYFHQWSERLAGRLDAYLSGLAAAVDAFCQEHFGMRHHQRPLRSKSIICSDISGNPDAGSIETGTGTTQNKRRRTYGKSTIT